jgi:hypothetical protein
MPSTRHIILHAHMFKNAGTTLDWSLQRCFGASFTDHRDDNAMRGNTEYLNTYIGEHSQLQALSSHWLPILPVPLAKFEAHLILLLRNPIERCRSVYNFERKQENANGPGNIKARTLSFKDYIKWRLKSGTGPVIKNFHTRYCSGDYFGNDMEKLFDLAAANLEATPYVGLVHRYTESMALFEHHLSSVFPTIDLSWQVQNSSQSAQKFSEDRVEIISEELGETYAALIAENAHDMRLLQLAEDKLDQALSLLPDVESRLTSIRRRNAQLV